LCLRVVGYDGVLTPEDYLGLVPLDAVSPDLYGAHICFEGDNEVGS